MLWRGAARRSVKAVVVAGAVLLAAARSAAGSPARIPDAAARSSPSAIDVEIAIDGTASMETAIARARQDGARLITEVQSLLPDTRFAVVVFRDHGNPAGEYQLLQPLTSDVSKLQHALGLVTPHSNPSPDNGPAESYNLVFQQSYRDARMGWRPSARKVVVVLGDAEPNGAGAGGLLGCHDQSRDPEGLSTRAELAHMRAQALTMIMIRERSAEMTASLQCYQSLAAGAFLGGAARDAGGDVAGIILELIKDAYLPVRLSNDLGLALGKSLTGYTMTVHNPNPVAVNITSLQVTLPAGFRYVASSLSNTATVTPSLAAVTPSQEAGTLSWALEAPLPANTQLRLHLLLRAGGRVGRYQSSGSVGVKTADGVTFAVPSSKALVIVRRRITALTLRLVGPQRATAPTFSGRIAVHFRRFRGLPALAPASGRVVLRSHGSALVLRARQLRLLSLDVPTRARLALRVAAAQGRPTCHPGARATLLVIDSTRAPDFTRQTTLALTLPPACGGALRPLANLSTAIP